MDWKRILPLLLCLAVWNSAAAEPTIEQLSVLRGGATYDVVVESGYAYAAGNRGLTVFDVSDPDHPAKLSFTELSSSAEDVEFHDGVFYVATRGWNGAIEIFQPYGSEPHHFGKLDGALGSTRIQVVDDHLYAVGAGDLYVYDVSIPLSPQHVGTLEMTSSFVISDFLVEGDVAWLTADYPVDDYWESTLLKADVSSPSAPVLDTSFHWGRTTFGPLNLVDGLLHLFENGDTRRYLTPSMEYAGRLPVDAYSFYPVSEGYLVDHRFGVSLLQDTTELHELRLPGVALEGSMEGDFIYRAGAWYGWQIIDASDPFDLQLRSRIADPIHLDALIAEGDVVYAVGRELFTIDVSSPALPEVTYRDPDSDLTQVALGSGGYLFTDGGYRAIRSYDVSDPAAPVFLSEHLTGDGVEMVERNRRLYVATKNFGLQILDCSDPASGLPEIARGVDQYATRIVLGPEHAYVKGSEGYLIYDIRVPADPQVVGQFDPGFSINAHLIAYNHLLLMSQFHNVQVYSLEDPASPVLVLDGLPVPLDRGRAMDHEGIHLAAADESTLYLYDIRNPAAPIEVASAPLEINQRYPEDLVLDGHLIHIASVSGYSSMRLQSVVGSPPAGPMGLVLGSDRNPAWGSTRFWFEAPFGGPLELRLYDLRGRLVRAWLVDARSRTRGEVRWDGTDDRGNAVASGIYFLRARVGGTEGRHRLVWMK